MTNLKKFSPNLTKLVFVLHPGTMNSVANSETLNMPQMIFWVFKFK